MQEAGRFVPYLALLLWTLFLYFPGIAQPFVYDDQFQIVNNPRIQNVQTAFEYFRAPVGFEEEFEIYSGAFLRPGRIAE